MAAAKPKHLFLGALLLLVVALVLPPFINVNRYRARIVEAASKSLGRPVAIGAISLSLLPQPSFTIENFVVSDDPSFSAEPILRAEEVRATLRMTSLWRGKLEIAKLSLQYPSLNLVRNADGRLNLESLLAHASRTPSAPTTARKPESRVRFPYIQANAGRINFKSGLEKKAFALSETDFALWSETENEWRMRLVGRPVRTDTNVTDTGTLRVEGSFRRADQLRDTPVQLQFSMERGQLGQITKLIYGRDRGWRGNAEFSGTASGTPAGLQLAFDAAVQDFRRYDIARGEAIRLQVHCSALVGATQESVRDLQCSAPAGTGFLRAAGRLTGWNAPSYDLTLLAEQVPANWLVAFARHAKRDLPDDLSATGTIVAEFHATKSESAAAVWTGNGAAEKVVLKSEFMGKDLALERIAFAFPSANSQRPSRGLRGVVIPGPPPSRLEFADFAVPMGAISPVAASGSISAEGYTFSVQGDAELERLTQVARVLGIAVPHFRATGPARLVVTIEGPWKGFVQPSATGTIQLRDARAEIPGIAQPVAISSAIATLAATEIRMQNIAATVDDVGISGAATFPRSCEQDLPCVSRWNVQIDEIDPTKLNALLNPRMKKRPWYRFFGGGDREESVLARIDATGHLTAKRLVLQEAVGTRISADFTLRDADLELTNLRADILGGTHIGALKAEFSGPQPVYTGTGTVSRLNLAQLAAMTKEAWGTGTLSATYSFKMSGWSAPELASSITASSEVDVRDGTLRRFALDGRGAPLRFNDFTARLILADGQFRIPESKLQTQSGIYQVSGTATFNRELTLQLSGAGGTAYKVTGTLEKPTVVPVPAREAEASLKK